MKRLVFAFIFALSLVPLTSSAQLFKFGYLSYNEVLRSMPEFAAAQNAMKELKAKYDAETKHNEEQFNKMFADFLQGQKDFPLNIMLKRQKELQEAMEKGVSFRQEVKDLLTAAEKEMKMPIMNKLDSAIVAVGNTKGYEYILNTDEKSFPFIHKGCGEDVTSLVKEKLATIKE